VPEIEGLKAAKPHLVMRGAAMKVVQELLGKPRSR
jgi:hypothetical protein